MTAVQCLGGWCKRRESCANYHAPKTTGLEPSERLCPPGQDEPEPVKRPRFGQWIASSWPTTEERV